MHIADILAPDHVEHSTSISSKKGALEELSGLMSGVDPALSRTEIFACLNARERLGSTGLGHGVAIPHGRYAGINRPVAAMLRLQQGINYDAVDQQPVDILFSLLVPAQSTEQHLQILAMLAEKFSDPDLLQRLRQAATTQELYTLIAR